MIEQWMLVIEIADTRIFQGLYVVVVVAWLDYAANEYACYYYDCSILEYLDHLDDDVCCEW